MIEYAANVVWTEDDDGTLHIYGRVDQEFHTGTDHEGPGEPGTMSMFLYDPFAEYAPGDWQREFIPVE